MTLPSQAFSAADRNPVVLAWWRSPAVGTGSIVLLALIVRAMVFIGYQGQDDRNYLAYAQYLASGQDLRQLDVHNQWIGRIGFWMPVAASIRAFGASEWVYVLYPLLVSLAGVPLVLALAAETVGRRAGLIAALLLAVLPLDVLYATRAYPDVPLGVLMVAAFWLALKSRASKRSMLWGLAAGLAMGLAYLNKETAVFAFLPLGILLRFWSRRHWSSIAGIGVAFTVVLIIEAGVWTWLKGDPLYRVHSTGAGLSEQGTSGNPLHAPVSQWLPGPRLRDAYRSTNTVADAVLMLTTNEELGLLYWLVVPLIAWSWATRDRSTRELNLWVSALLVVILFFPVAEWPRVTLPRDPRYLTCLTIPALLLVAAYLDRMTRTRRSAVTTALVCASAAGLFIGYESSTMELQRTLLQKQATNKELLWVTPQLAADLLALGGMDSAPSVGMHLIEQGRTANAYQAAIMIRPKVTVAESATDIKSGVLVLRDDPDTSVPPGWRLRERVIPRASLPIRHLQQALRTVGLVDLARRLSSSEGQTASLYVLR